MRRATIELKESRNYTVALDAVRPEAEEGMNRVSIKVCSDEPRIEIQAQDSHALRAALNSYLRWLDVTSNIAETYVSKEESK